MSDSTLNRKPPGTPSGGQFARKTSGEAGLTLDDPEPPEGWELDQETYEVNEQRRWPCEPPDVDLPSSSLQHGDDSWAKVGVSDPMLAKRLEDRGVAPEDFSSSDRSARMWACAERGDMVFEGELLSGALQLHRHAEGIDERRHFHAPGKVYVGGNSVAWSSLPTDKQLAYIRGYARGVASSGPGGPPPPEDPMSADGYRRGRYVDHASQMIHEGHLGRPESRTSSVAIVDSSAMGHRLVVTDIQPVPERDGYTAKVTAGQYRRHESDDGVRHVPWSEGATVFFYVDALGADS